MIQFRKIDIILYIVCIISVSIAFYDLYHLNQIEERAIDRCNEHWLKEFNTKCTAYINTIDNPEGLGSLNYSFNLSSLSSP